MQQTHADFNKTHRRSGRAALAPGLRARCNAVRGKMRLQQRTRCATSSCDGVKRQAAPEGGTQISDRTSAHTAASRPGSSLTELLLPPIPLTCLRACPASLRPDFPIQQLSYGKADIIDCMAFVSSVITGVKLLASKHATRYAVATFGLLPAHNGIRCSSITQ
jgi:hypothetical protein